MYNATPRRRTGLTAALIVGLIVTAILNLLAHFVREDGSSATAQDARLMATTIEAARLPAPPRGNVSGTVHDIFGDPIPHAQVQFGERITRADERGSYRLDGLPVGSHDVRVAADQHQPRAFRYSVYEGESSPRIKYDSGLWPESFAIDFHIFHPPSRPDPLYGLIGLANPENGPIYVTSMKVVTRDGSVVQDFMEDVEGIQRFVFTYGSTRLSLEPSPAIVIPARGAVTHIEMQPFPPDSDQYSLVVTYSTRSEYRAQNEKRAEKVAAPSVEEDYNPHSP